MHGMWWLMIAAAACVVLPAAAAWRRQVAADNALFQARLGMGGVAVLEIPDPPTRVHARDEGRHDAVTVEAVRRRIDAAIRAGDDDTEVVLPAGWWSCRG